MEKWLSSDSAPDQLLQTALLCARGVVSLAETCVDWLLGIDVFRFHSVIFKVLLVGSGYRLKDGGEK